MRESQLWTFFDKIRETHTGVCKICDTSISYKSTTSNLKAHLKKKHSEIYNNFFLTSPMPNREANGDKTEGENVLSDNGSDSIKILITSNSDIWDVFERVHSTKTALCYICNKYISFETSINNLKDHLKLNHAEVHDLITREPSSAAENVKESMEQPYSSKKCSSIWKFFEPEHTHRMAKCNDCQKVFSYKSTIGNLKQHLKSAHWTTYNKLINMSTSQMSKEDSSDDDTFEQIKHSNNSNSEKELPYSEKYFIADGCDNFRRKARSRLWEYFEKNRLTKIAECHLCQKMISYRSTTTNLKQHLKIKHIKAYEQLLSKGSSDPCKNTKIMNNHWEEENNKEYNNQQIIIKGSFGENSKGEDIPKHIVDSTEIKITDTDDISLSQNGSHGESSDEEQSFLGLRGKKYSKTSKDNSSTRSLSSILAKEICKSEISIQDNTLNSLQDKMKKGTIWKYYKSNQKTKIAQCNLCLQKISYKTTTSNLKQHLRARHRQVYNDCVSLSSPQSNNFHTIFISADKEQKNESCVNDDHYSETLSFDSDNGNKQITSERDPFDSNIFTSAPPSKLLQRQKQNMLLPEDKKLVDWHLLKVITEDFQPFTIVEDRGFKEFVAVLNPHYQLPDWNVLSTALLTDEYNNRVAKYQNVTQVCSSCTLTLECWTSKSLQRFIAVTGHFINKDTFQFHSVLLKCVTLQSQHTPDTIASELRHITSSWSILNKVNLIVSEDVFDIAAASRLLNISHFECYISKFNSVILEALNEFSISSIVMKVHRTVEYFETNIEAKQKLFYYQTSILGIKQPKNLSLSVLKHWHSVYDMLKTFSDLQEALSATILSITDEITIITLEEWQCINEIVKVLKPFDEATTVMSNEGYLKASNAVVLRAGLYIECTYLLECNFCDPVKCLISKLEDGLSTKFNDLEKNKEISICTLLDPRFKQHAFEDQVAMLNAKQYLLEKYEEMNSKNVNTNMPTNSSSTEKLKPLSSLWNRFYTKVASSYPDDKHQTVKELNMYFTENVIPQTECPLRWWKERQMLYPVLSKIFVNSFNTVVTSLGCNRAFSKSAYVLLDRRKCLPAPEVDKIMFLHTNK